MSDEKIENAPEVKLVEAMLQSKENSELSGFVSTGNTENPECLLNEPILTPMIDKDAEECNKGIISRIMSNIRSFFTGW